MPPTSTPRPRRPPRRTILPGVLTALAVAGAVAPTVVAPRTRGALAIVIATTELSPLVALGAVLVAILTLVVVRDVPRLRTTLAALALVAAVIATGPARRARSAARASAPALAALGADVSRGPDVRWGDVLSVPPVPAPIEVRTIAQRAPDGTRLEHRLYRAAPHGRAPTAPRAVVVELYGGAWQGGTSHDEARVDARLAALGYVVLALDYRHAPAARWPAQGDDVRRGLALVADSAHAWNADLARVALWGRSSGAHLALRTAWDTAALPVRVRGVVDYYGPYDLAEGYRDPPSPDPLDVRAILRTFLGGAPEARAAAYRDASPSTLVRSGLPPTLLVYGRRDHIVLARFGREAAEALRRAGVPVVHVELPNAEHGFDAVPNGVDAQAARWVTERFLAAVLRTP